MPKVLEKVEVPRCPLRIEVPVEWSERIDDEKCDTMDFRSKFNESNKEEEIEVGPIPVEKTCVAGIKEHPMETKRNKRTPKIQRLRKVCEQWRSENIQKKKRQGTQKRKEVGRAGIGRRVAVTYLLPPRSLWNLWNGRRKRSAWRSHRMKTDIGATP